MIRALLVYPDNPSHRGVLNSLAREPGLSLVADCVYVDDAMEKIETLRPDVVFVGVEASGPISLGALNWPGYSKRPHVVVISDCERYALEAFAINAVDYLLIPMDQARLKAALYKLRRDRKSVV